MIKDQSRVITYSDAKHKHTINTWSYVISKQAFATEVAVKVKVKVKRIPTQALRTYDNQTEAIASPMQSECPVIGPVYQAFKKDLKNRPDKEEIHANSDATRFYFSDWNRLEMHNDMLYRI